MKIDFATLAFGYSIRVGGGTPNWATSLGQSREREYRINADPEIDELLKGMTYKSVPLSRISTKIGKGGKMYQGNLDDSPIIMAALFSKVYINNTKIENGRFIILVTRDTSDSHSGRLRFKYGPSNTFSSVTGELVSNELFWKTARAQLGLGDNACYFVYDICVENQDVLRLKTVVVDKSVNQSYNDSIEHHKAWEHLISENNKEYGWTDLPGDSFSEEGSDDSGNCKICKNTNQTIYYGVPGSGKSNAIERLTSELKVASTQKVRVVFHPDYSNADFVGQIMPKKVGDNVSYDFKAGPFTTILKKAYNELSKPFYLIIEEINRGNAAAIFGDIFQLLDREVDSWSKYEITNEEVCKEVHGDEKAREKDYMVKLPPNLSILATMNTSDQNVFTLDNAFQRRWKMIHVKNKFQDDEDSIAQKDSIIEGTSLTWGEFLFGVDGKSGINAIIAKSSSANGMSSLEDKRLGCWFVINKDKRIKEDDFSNKVLKYLWDDAFHFDKSAFADGIESFDELVEAFGERQPLFRDLVIPYSDEPKTTEAGE